MFCVSPLMRTTRIQKLLFVGKLTSLQEIFRGMIFLFHLKSDCIAELPTWKGANYLDDDGRNNNDDGKAEKGECSLAKIFKSTLLQTPSYCKKASSLTAQHD